MNIVLAIIVLLGYTIALCIKGGGVPSSLSASVFDLPKEQRWIWTVVLYAVCFCVLVPFGWHGVSFLDKVSENTQFLAFIAIAALAFVGAAPLVAYLVYMAIDKKHWTTKVFWAEMVCFGSTFAFCLI